MVYRRTRKRRFALKSRRQTRLVRILALALAMCAVLLLSAVVASASLQSACAKAAPCMLPAGIARLS